MKKGSIKNIRVCSEVQRELSSILQGEIKDPRIPSWISVVSVDVAPDLKTAKAYISILGDQKTREEAMKGLKSAEGYVRRQLAGNLNLRITPEIQFIVDQSIEYGVNMYRKIEELSADRSGDGGENAE